jgi:signal transduction histidine kinase
VIPSTAGVFSVSSLAPAIVAATTGSLLLVAVYLYLFSTQGRERYLLLWACAWAGSALRYGLTLVAALRWADDPPRVVQAAIYLSSHTSAFLLLWGTYAFVGGRLPAAWVALAVAGAAWIVGASAADLSFFQLTLPVYTLTAAMSINVGVMILRFREVPGVGRSITGWVFVAWGLHRANYPFLRPLEWFAPWGFMIASMLEVAVTIGQLLLHMEKNLERLRESKARYRQLVETSPDAIFLVSSGEVHAANVAAERLLGAVTRSVPLERQLIDFVGELGARSTAQSPRPVALPAGDRDLELRAMPLGAGALQLVVQDVTERRRFDEHLRDAAKMEAVGRLAGGVAHDFNNLLTAILGYSSLILLEKNDASRGAYVHEVQRACGRASDLTRQLLAFARRQPIEPRVVEVDDIVAGATSLIEQLAGAKVTLSMRLGAAAARALVDPAQLELSIVNLAVNARDAMPAGGSLTISTRAVAGPDLPPAWSGPRDDGAVAISVADTGLGMDPATRARLFEPFFTTKPKGKGTGLGLATVHGIVARCGGTIDVETAPGSGTTFTIHLPRTTAALSPTVTAPSSTSPPARGGTILLAEDETSVRDMAAQVLRQAGYTVLACRDGEAALAAAAAHTGPIDLLLSDLVMPGCSGLELAERLRAARPAVRVLLTSGYAADVLGDRAQPADGTRLLAKPFSPDSLTARVGEAMAT